MRDSFVFYRNMWEQLLLFKDSSDLLSFVKAVNNYAFYGEEPVFENPIQNAMWMGIKDKLDRDHEKYLKVCKRNKERSKEIKENDNDNENENKNDVLKEKKFFYKGAYASRNYPTYCQSAMPTTSKMRLQTPKEIAAARKADADAERQRIVDTVEAYRQNPDNKRLAELVKMMQANGTLKKYGIVESKE